jgi:hypothetical protein
MSTVIDSTVGGASSNSYATLAEGNTYFETRLNTSVWDAAEDADKEKALITATAKLDEYDYVGGRASTTQRLRFPRFMVPKPDSNVSYGSFASYYTTTEIPQLIKDATCELAQDMLSSMDIETGNVGDLSEVKVGDILTVSFKESSAGVIPSRIAALLRGFRLNVSGVPMVRG